MALESWKDSVDQYQYVQADHVLNTKYNPVPGLVEILFDFLPAIRGMRQTYCSRAVEGENLEGTVTTALLREPAALRSVITMQHFTSEEPMFDESSVDSANLKFEKVDSIFRKLDKILKKESHYTSRLQSEKESLNRFHDDRRNRRSLNAVALDGIIEKQIKLDNTLGEQCPIKMILDGVLSILAEFIKDSPDVSNLSVHVRRFLRKRQGKEVENKIKQAESLLSFLTNTNRSMRNMFRA